MLDAPGKMLFEELLPAGGVVGGGVIVLLGGIFGAIPETG